MFHKGSERWDQEQVLTNYVFDFQKEIVEYCISDIDILAQASIEFGSMFLHQCNLEPLFRGSLQQQVHATWHSGVTLIEDIQLHWSLGMGTVLLTTDRTLLCSGCLGSRKKWVLESSTQAVKREVKIEGLKVMVLMENVSTNSTGVTLTAALNVSHISGRSL